MGKNYDYSYEWDVKYCYPIFRDIYDWAGEL
jgi:hypothetical protein